MDESKLTKEKLEKIHAKLDKAEKSGFSIKQKRSF
jgi:hypothetical protein